CIFFFSSRRRHTRFSRDWSSDVCSSDLAIGIERERVGAGQDAAIVQCARGSQCCIAGQFPVGGLVENNIAAAVQSQRVGLDVAPDRKSTRLNSSHVKISYAVFCLKKKKE